ncbi:MAG TPA: hypothetical protein PKA64_16455, partial [Myxococcota bacterium]|nr:hypothetical protein [Myxococcota bacterium]
DGCVTLVEIDPPSHAPPAAIASPGACARIHETSTALNPHELGNLTQFMALVDGTIPGSVARVEVRSPVMDWSIRSGSNHLASPGNFSPTTPWPNLGDVGSGGAARFRGFLRIGCGESTERTIGLIGNDSVRLVIEGATVIEENWASNRWKKFRWVSFPGPGLYAFEIQWSTNLCCDIDPMELVWSDTLIPGYQAYDTMCNSSACGVYNNNVPIPGLRVVDGDELASTSTGAAGSCAQCRNDGDCGAGRCNAAGLCE